jgi:hypothetical protein
MRFLGAPQFGQLKLREDVELRELLPRVHKAGVTQRFPASLRRPSSQVSFSTQPVVVPVPSALRSVWPSARNPSEEPLE